MEQVGSRMATRFKLCYFTDEIQEYGSVKWKLSLKKSNLLVQ